MKKEFTYEILTPLGIISQRTDYDGVRRSMEVNLVSWNGKNPVLDIRDWSEDHQEIGRGVKLNSDETKQLYAILDAFIKERGNS